MKTITILTDCTALPTTTTGDLAVFWSIPSDSFLAKRYAHAIPLNQILIETKADQLLAAALIKEWVKDEPVIDQIPHLLVCQETIFLEIYKILRLWKLHQWLLERGYQRCIFPTASWLDEGLKTIVNLLHSPLQCVYPQRNATSRWQRVLKRLQAEGFSRASLSEELSQLYLEIDPFRRWPLAAKSVLGIAPPRLTPGQLWFYSTAATYTQISLQYEPYFPEPFQFLVTKPSFAGKPLAERGRSFTALYAFVDKACIPSTSFVKDTIQHLYVHLKNAANHSSLPEISPLFLKGDWLARFFTILLPRRIFLSRVLKNWLEIAKPSALVLGNQGTESYLTFQAKQLKIKTILLQHGILGRDYPYLDYPIDYYFMRGKFWFNHLCPSAQQRALILNTPVETLKQPSISCQKPYLIFATTPTELHYMTMDSHVEDLLNQVIEASAANNLPLMIRVHPLERVAHYQHLVQQSQSASRSKVNISYSQGGEISTLLQQAAAVVMYTSTLFLDCIRHGIPIISFQWMHFGAMEALKAYDVFHYAEDYTALRKLIKGVAEQTLKPKLLQSTLFFESTDKNHLVKTIEDILVK